MTPSQKLLTALLKRAADQGLQEWEATLIPDLIERVEGKPAVEQFAERLKLIEKRLQGVELATVMQRKTTSERPLPTEAVNKIMSL